MKSSSFLTLGLTLVALAGGSVRAQTLNVSTWTGSAQEPGEVNAEGSAARFLGPYGIAVDAPGDAYVADHGGGVVRHIAGGQVTTLAARFLSPYGIATDGAGNVYVTDTLNFVVDRIASDGTMTVFAGILGSRGTADGGAGVAQFSGPTGIAIDSSGNLYVADTNRDSRGAALREIAPDGTVTTLASGFVDLRGVAVGSSGIFVCDSGDNTIRQVAANGTVTLIAGIPALTGSNDGPGTTARFNEPSALALDGAGNLYVADFGNSVIRQVTPSGNVTTVAGLAVVVGSSDGSGSAARFYTPAGIAIDANGTVYICDTGNSTVRIATGAAAAPVIAPAATSAGTGASASLVNLSVRAFVGDGAGTLTVGFVAAGSSPLQVLVRGIGPTLASYGVSDALAQPGLALYSGSGSQIASDAGWGGGAALAGVMASVGAFSLPANSADSALDETLPSGSYTAQVTALNGTSGQAMAEIYQVGSGSGSQLVNVSSLANVGAGDGGPLVAGFVVGGSGNETVLVRGVGPTLAQYGVTGVLAAPQLTVFDAGGNAIATNDGWAGSASLAAVAQQVGAFPLEAGSSDAALVLTLAPGNYTAQVTGAGGAAGMALIEVYAVP